MRLKVSRNVEQDNAQATSDDVVCVPSDLDAMENGLFDEVVLSDVLDFQTDREKMLHDAVKKLMPEGRISIHGLDLIDVASYISTGKLSRQQMKQVVYHGRQSASDIYEIQDQLRNMGLEVEYVTKDNFYYNVIARVK